MELKTIAVIHNGYKDKFGVPRQSGMLENARSEIVFEKEFRSEVALRGIEGFSHLWLLWLFSENEPQTSFSPTVRPPRLGGNKRMGVFATRSPYRPNPIGLSSVKLIDIQKRRGLGTVLIVSGADLVDGTPIIDVKPYISFTDCHPDAVSGFADEFVSYRLDVICDEKTAAQIDGETRRQIFGMIACDPRPSYHDDADRVYKMDHAGYKIFFKADKKTATVIDIIKCDGEVNA